MKLFIFCLLLALALGQQSQDEEWESFKLKHNKSYKDDDEEAYRKGVFVETKNKIADHNARFEAGEVTFKLKLNHLSDLKTQEVKQRMNGHKPTARARKHHHHHHLDGDGLPGRVNWVRKGAVTPVKDQGTVCGSCWAFSTTGSVEGQMYLRKGLSVNLSEQNLIDCTTSYGNAGCAGGNVDPSFQYIHDNGGIDSEVSYPYEGKDDVCRYNPGHSLAMVKSYVDLPEGDEHSLRKAVAEIGPISIGIDASHDSFTYYSEGVYYEPACSSDGIDHDVLVVGYGRENGLDYWLVKNSWGTGWGEKGYIKMSMYRDNNCGIASEASYPIVE